MHTNYLKESNPVITISIKDYGNVVLELFPEVAPNTVKNFVNLVEENYFDNSKFHRVIKGFMIQGGIGNKEARAIVGEFSSNGFENPLKHQRGVISMARTPNRNSASSQFFIMHENSPHLDGEYAGFGIVTKGIEIVDEIANEETNMQDVPLVDVVIENITVDTKGFNYSKAKYV